MDQRLRKMEDRLNGHEMTDEEKLQMRKAEKEVVVVVIGFFAVKLK